MSGFSRTVGGVLYEHARSAAVIAIDTSAMIAYLGGESGADVEAVDAALAHKAAVLPPPVLTELLSAPNLQGFAK